MKERIIPLQVVQRLKIRLQHQQFPAVDAAFHAGRVRGVPVIGIARRLQICKILQFRMEFGIEAVSQIQFIPVGLSEVLHQPTGGIVGLVEEASRRHSGQNVPQIPEAQAVFPSHGILVACHGPDPEGCGDSVHFPAFVRECAPHAREELFLSAVSVFFQKQTQIRKTLFRLQPLIALLIHHKKPGKSISRHLRSEVPTVHRLKEDVACLPVEGHDFPQQLIGNLFKADPQQPAFRRDLAGRCNQIQVVCRAAFLFAAEQKMEASVLSRKERADGARHRLHGQERDQLFARSVLKAVTQNIGVLHAKKPVCRLSCAESVHILRQLLRHARRTFTGMNDAEPEVFVILQDHGKPAVPCPADLADRKGGRNGKLFFPVQSKEQNLHPLRYCHKLVTQKHRFRAVQSGPRLDFNFRTADGRAVFIQEPDIVAISGLCSLTRQPGFVA